MSLWGKDNFCGRRCSKQIWVIVRTILNFVFNVPGFEFTTQYVNFLTSFPADVVTENVLKVNNIYYLFILLIVHLKNYFSFSNRICLFNWIYQRFFCSVFNLLSMSMPRAVPPPGMSGNKLNVYIAVLSYYSLHTIQLEWVVHEN